MVSNETIIKMRNRDVRMENEGKFWSDEDSQSLDFYYQEGYGITEMAYLLQRSERAVYQQLTLMGAFQSPIKRNIVPKDSKCLCSGCKLAPALCPCGELCPKRMEAV